MRMSSHPLIKTVFGAFLLALICFALPTISENKEQAALLTFMETELQRNSDKLKLETYEKPYYISYHLVDRETLDIAAYFGALKNSDLNHRRVLDVDVRVGDYSFDSSKTVDELWDQDEEEGRDLDEYSNVPVALGEDPAAIQHALWHLTDIRYKRALAHYLRKKGKAAQLVQEKDRSDDFTKENPAVYTGEKASLSMDAQAVKNMEKMLMRVSSNCKFQTEILSCEISFSAEAKNHYFVSSEGFKILHGKTVYQIVVSTEAKAEDGMWVESYRAFLTATPDKLPDKTTLESTLNLVMKEVTELKNAPAMEAYVGPAIIQSPASGVFFHEILGHRLEAHRQESKTESETFKDKVGQKIMPEFLTVVDDPTLKEYHGELLDGHYLFDDEGVPSQRTLLVENGVLKTFLMSRKPIKNFNRSNGHGRASLRWMGWGNDTPVPRQGNFIIETNKPLPLPELKKLLIKESKAQKKKYGLIMFLAEYGFTETSRYSMDVFVTKPLLVYKVDVETGKEQLVRGVKLGGTPLVGLNKILAAGDDPKVFHGYCGAESGTIPVALVAPSILMSEIEIAKIPSGKSKQPLLPPPPED